MTMYLKSVCFLGASLALRGQMRVKYFCILSILSDSNGQCLSNAKNQTSLSCLCAEKDARKHLYFFKKGAILWAPSVIAQWMGMYPVIA
jgi:hypothetical protein